MPRPKSGVRSLKGNLSELQLFSGLELRLHSINAQVETKSSGIDDPKTVVPEKEQAFGDGLC
jgi:hypothetical protein